MKKKILFTIIILIIVITIFSCFYFFKFKINNVTPNENKIKTDSLENSMIDDEEFKDNYIYISKSDLTSYLDDKNYLKVFYILENTESEAKQILYKYLLEESEKEDELTKNSMRRTIPDWIRAFEVDLNDDGINEVIGIIPDRYWYSGAISGEIFLLEKINGKYKKMENLIMHNYNRKFMITPEKTNGYHNIIVSIEDTNDNITKGVTTAQYIDGKYQYTEMKRLKP